MANPSVKITVCVIERNPDGITNSIVSQFDKTFDTGSILYLAAVNQPNTETVNGLPLLNSKIIYNQFGLAKVYYAFDSILTIQNNINGVSVIPPVVPSPIGVINDESAWASLTDFSVVGNATATIGVSGGKLNMTGGSGGSLFTNYVYFSKSGSPFIYTCLEKWTQRIIVTTPSSFNSTSFGLGIGIKSTNPNVAQSNYIRWGWDSGNNQIRMYFTDSISGQAVGNVLVPVANTTYVIDVSRVKDVLTVTIYASDGTTVLQTSTFNANYTYPSSGGSIFHNTGHFALQNFGGTFNISSWTISSTANRFCDYVAAGDSNMYGLHVGTGGGAVTSRYVEQAMATKNKTFEIVAGIDDHSQDILNRLPEIIYMAPRSVYLNILSNDIADGVSSGTWQANYNSIVSQLQAAGITVKLGTPIARSIDVTAAQTFINGLSNTKVDLFNVTKTGTNLNATYNSGDGIHMNLAGNNACVSPLSGIL